MTSRNHVYIVTTIDSDGDTWIVHVCDTLDTAQYARLQYANQLVRDGIFEDDDAAIDRRHIRISYNTIEDRDDIESAYPNK